MKKWNVFRLIRHKVLFFGLIMSSLPLLLISLYYFFAMSSLVEEKVLEKQELQAENLANNINSMVDQIYSHIEVLGNSPNLIEKKTLYHLLSEHEAIDEIVILDDQGVPITYISRNKINIWDSNEIWPVNSNIFEEVLQEGSTYSHVIFNDLEQPTIQLMADIEGDSEHKAIGVSLQLQKMIGELSSIKLQDNSSIYLLDKFERIIAHQNFSLLWQEEFLIEDHGSVMVSSVPIHLVDWQLVLEQPRKDMLAPIFDMLKRGGFVAMLLIMFISLISVLAGLYFVKPIENLQRGMRGVKKGNFEKTLKVDRNDELGELTKTFNEMNEEINEKSNRLLQEKERLDIIVNSMGAGLAIVKKDYTVSWMNPTLKNWVGSGRDVPCFQLFNDMESPCYSCPMNSLKNFEKSDDLMTKVDKDGEIRIFRHRVYPLQYTLGDGEEALIVMEDITDEKLMEEKLIQTDKLTALGLMASNFAHEVNNPLATVQVYAEDLTDRLKYEKDDLVESGEMEQYLQIIQKNIDRCKEITKNLLNFSRKSDWSIEPLNVWQVLDDSLSLLRPSIKKKKISLQISERIELPTIYGDAIKLSQVFVNIIQNAIDAMEDEDDAQLKIHVKAIDEEHIQIDFQDNGSGIEQEQLSKLFDPFYTSKPIGKGTGLGLSVCYGIIERFGGKIEVDSEKGKGTSFIITLPCEDENIGGK